jgi:hypothetical protein
VRPKFSKAFGIGIIGYILLLVNTFAPKALIGIGVVWMAWFSFCLWRLAKGIRFRWYRSDAAEWDREDFGFALGGSIATLVCVPAWLFTPFYVH